MLWCGPFHGRDSLGVIEPVENNTERKERKVELLTPVVRGSFKYTEKSTKKKRKDTTKCSA